MIFKILFLYQKDIQMMLDKWVLMIGVARVTFRMEMHDNDILQNYFGHFFIFSIDQVKRGSYNLFHYTFYSMYPLRCVALQT